ncbi:MAG: Fe-S cluster assembly protein IscX [Chromatiaceae bacterium]
MGLKWTDALEVAIALDEAHPDVDPRYVSFVDLRMWVIGLTQFDDNPARSGETALEAIQMAWMEERD